MAPSSGTKGGSLSSISLLYSPMVTVRVGSEKQEFCVHKELLCSHSTYFAKALSGPFLEAQTRIFELEDIHVVPFKVFVAWCYTGKIAFESSGSGASSFRECDQLNTALAEENPYEAEEEEDDDDDDDEREGKREDDLSRFDEANPRTWTHLVLGALFVLGDRLDAAKFKRQVLDAIIRRKFDGIVLAHSAILYAYANTTRSSPLRRLCVHIAAYETSYKASHITWNHLPVDYLTAVMMTMGRRLPAQQCRSCLQTAISDNGMTPEDFDDVHVEEDLPPYKHDRCFYHEHKDEEEAKTCRAAREEESEVESDSE